MKFFLNNIELILSGAGLVVIMAVPALFFTGTNLVFWEAATVTAVVVGVLHGTIFWLVRRKQRKVRDEAINEIRMMLKDIVNNQLTVITLSASTMEAQRLQHVSNSIAQISTLINTLSEESLVTWRTKYEETLRQLHGAAKI